MKKILVVLSVCLMSLSLFQCKEEKENPHCTILKNGLEELKNEQITLKTQIFSAPANIPFAIKGRQGTTLKTNYFLDENDKVVNSGNVKVELIEVYDKADIILLDKPTIALSDEGKIQPLESGGMFYIKASQNGKPLRMYASLQTRVGEFRQNGMKLFNLNEQNQQTVWQLANNAPNVEICPDSAQLGTYCLTELFGLATSGTDWYNIDRFIDITSNNSFSLKLPNQFNAQNAKVCLSIIGARSLFPLQFDETKRDFALGFGLLSDVSIHLIALVDDGGVLKYALQKNTTIADKKDFVLSDFIPTTVDNFKKIVNQLP